jgi:cytoskeletal protein CcmA (bactofilin family)
MATNAQVGASVVIKGELIAEEDVTIAGRVEGTIRVEGHIVTVNAGGHVAADIEARAIVVSGRVKGRVVAEDRIDLRDGADVDGDLVAPRIGMAEGARFNGRVEMPERAASPLALAS